jgi:DNA-binding NtrC family response regulator
VEKKTILIADDILEVRENIAMTLGEENYNYFFSPSGEDALKIVMKEKIDVIIADIAMPHGNGLELIKNIEKLDSPPRVILVTGYADMFTEDEAHSKADYIIEKPFSQDELQNIVKKLISS